MCYAGKGVPMEIRLGSNRAAAIDPSSVPTVQAAVQLYNGTLTRMETFGRDPLEQNPRKKELREREFKKYFI